MSKRYVGTFYSVDSALYKITELNSSGYGEHQISAVAYSDIDLAQLRKQSSVALDGQGQDGFLSKFKASFVDRKQKQLDLFADMGFTQAESDKIYHELEDGGIAIFVDDVEVERTPEEMGGGIVEDTERDSRAALTDSFEVLAGEKPDEPQNDDEETVPRLNTDGL